MNQSLCHVMCSSARRGDEVQLQGSENFSFRSHSQPRDCKNRGESKGRRSKRSFIRIEPCYSELALRDAGHREFIQPPQVP